MVHAYAVVLPVIGVTLPDVATESEQRALLDACDQAFEVGDCVEASDPDTTAGAELRAVVQWLNDTEAHVTVMRVEDDGSDQELVTFAPADARVERYRALGFAIGSLASSFVQTEEPEPIAPPPAPAPTPIPTPDEYTSVAPDWDTPPPPTKEKRPLPPSVSRNYLEAGALVGNGFQNPRFGAGVNLWVSIYDRWASELSLDFATQGNTTDGVGLSFFSAEASAGPRILVGHTLLSFLGGIQAQHLSGRLADFSAGRPRPALGALASVHARATDGFVSPFVGLRLSWLEETEISISDTAADGSVLQERTPGIHGPLQFGARLGLSIALGQ